MANDLDIRSPGGLTNYAPSPLSPTGNSQVAIDHLSGRELRPAQRVQQRQPTSPQVNSFFGESLPAGVTESDVDALLGQLGGVYVSDFSALKHPQKWINASLAYWSASYGQPAQPETKRHSYNLHELTNDVLANNWANQMSRVGASQKFISDSVWWAGELARRLQQSGAPAPASPGNFGSLDPSQYSDAEWNQILKANERAAAKTEITLRKKWGESYKSYIQAANEYLATLPPERQKQLTRLTAGGISGLNTPEVIEGLLNEYLGTAGRANWSGKTVVENIYKAGGALPKAGSNIASEIAAIENVMRTNRKAYLKDEAMQLRLRELYRLRDG